MKRRYRELDEETKEKISLSLRGKRKSLSHREKISNSMRNYWSNVPNKPQDNNKEK